MAPGPAAPRSPAAPSLGRTYALALGLGALWILLLWWLTVAFNQAAT